MTQTPTRRRLLQVLAAAAGTAGGVAPMNETLRRVAPTSGPVARVRTRDVGRGRRRFGGRRRRREVPA